MSVQLLEADTWVGFTHATPRDLTRRTHGGGIAIIADQLGRSGMPWQRHVWDVATEVDADGRFVYEIVLVTVPRQAGKTTLFGPVQIHRALTMRGIKTFYTAQTGKDARSRFNDLWQLIEGSPLAPRATLRRSAGDEAIRWQITGSQNKIFAPVEAALHGETPPLVGMDEIWELDELLGDALLEGAIIPAQISLDGRRQVWLMSTAGTAESLFMRKWVDRGRQSVLEPGSNPRMAYFEASLPDGADPYDPAVIERFHPAVGHTQTIESLMEVSGQVSRATWLRAFCNVWTETSDPFIPESEWRDMADTEIGARWADVAISWDVAPDNAMGAVMATWRDDAGQPCTRVLHAAPGTQWMVDMLEQLHRGSWAAFGADDGGPTRRITKTLLRRLTDAGRDTTRIVLVGGKDSTTAAETWITAARDEGELTHDGSKTLEHAIAHLVVKRLGEVVRISRTESTGPVAAAIASSIGLWLYDTRDTPTWSPVTKY